MDTDSCQFLKSLPGNDRCFDCGSLDTNWACISHGILLCLDCGGKHRSMGVQVSFVRSIIMDTWEPLQVEMMKLGGNEQLKAFFRKMKIENSPIHILYVTKAAEYYRQKLKEEATKIVASGKRIRRKKTRTDAPTSETQQPSSSSSQAMSDSNPITNQPYDRQTIIDLFSSQTILIHEIVISVNQSSLGFTLSQIEQPTNQLSAYVSRLTPNGFAVTHGIELNDVIIHLGGFSVVNKEFDKILSRLIELKQRGECLIGFARVVESKRSAGELNHSSNGNDVEVEEDFEKWLLDDSVQTRVASAIPSSAPTEEKVLDISYSVTFSLPGSLGLTFNKNALGRAVVVQIVPGGQAHSKGIAVGDALKSINGRPLFGYDEGMKGIGDAIANPNRQEVDMGLFRNPNPNASYSTSSVPPSSSLPKFFEVMSLDANHIYANTLKLAASLSAEEGSDKLLAGNGGIAIGGRGVGSTISGGFGSNDKDVRRRLEEAEGMGNGGDDDDDDEDDTGLMAELTDEDIELGFRLEEDRDKSMVTLVSPDLWASRAHIEAGMICIKINGNKCLSHAHTVATIKHGKRPLLIELKKKRVVNV